jgi:hypothetical protein
MKSIYKIAVFALITAFICSCLTQKKIADSSTGRLSIKDTVSVKDSTEYELLVFDPSFDYWFESHSYDKNQYSNNYLQTMNYQYAMEWNRRFTAGDLRIECNLDYSPLIKYGFEFNYKLFMYFKYFEETNKIKLISGRGR